MTFRVSPASIQSILNLLLRALVRSRSLFQIHLLGGRSKVQGLKRPKQETRYPAGKGRGRTDVIWGFWSSKWTKGNSKWFIILYSGPSFNESVLFVPEPNFEQFVVVFVLESPLEWISCLYPRPRESALCILEPHFQELASFNCCFWSSLSWISIFLNQCSGGQHYDCMAWKLYLAFQWCMDQILLSSFLCLLPQSFTPTFIRVPYRLLFTEHSICIKWKITIKTPFNPTPNSAVCSLALKCL